MAYDPRDKKKEPQDTYKFTYLMHGTTYHGRNYLYDPEKDKEKPFFHKLYEMLVGGVAKLLESHKTKDVATQAYISGEVGRISGNARAPAFDSLVGKGAS